MSSADERFNKIAEEVATLLTSKRSDYGWENIQELGRKGVLSRINDKRNRLKTMYESDKTVQHESLLDSWLDIAGYAIIGLMLERGEWILPTDPDYNLRIEAHQDPLFAYAGTPAAAAKSNAQLRAEDRIAKEAISAYKEKLEAEWVEPTPKWAGKNPRLVYLGGAVDCVSNGHANGWRKEATDYLYTLGIATYNPVQAFHVAGGSDQLLAQRIYQINSGALGYCSAGLFRLESNRLTLGTPEEIKEIRDAGRPCVVWGDEAVANSLFLAMLGVKVYDSLVDSVNALIEAHLQLPDYLRGPCG